MVMAYASLKLGDFAKYKTYMLATVLLPVLFLCIKGYEYYEKVSHDHLPSHSTFLAIYWTMTALHGLHIIGGIVVNGYFWGPGSKMWHTKPAMFENRVEAAGLYWHFVDLVWIFLFPVLYLL
jgi:heme/copper-type cytochrome/quinol oxidase subunit 3